jgi:hypothetical protein
MFLDQFTDPVDLFPAEAVAALQPNGVGPELRFTVVSFDMDMRRLTPIASAEEEPERADSEDSWHADMLHRPGTKSNTPHANGGPNETAQRPAYAEDDLAPRHPIGRVADLLK